MQYSYLTAEEEIEILRLSQIEKWSVEVISRRIKRSRRAVQDCIDRGRVRTPEERQIGQSRPLPTREEIAERGLIEQERHFLSMGCYRDGRPDFL